MRFVEFLALGLALLLAARWVLNAAVRSLVSNILASRPSAQNTAFVLRLRELAFTDPFALMTTLCGTDASAFVRQLWVETGWKIARYRKDAAPPPPDMEAKVFSFSDGRTLAVVCLPPTQQLGETLLVAVVLPMDPALKQDLRKAKSCVRFLFLNRYRLNRTTDLCGWTQSRELRTYNVGAPEDPKGLAAAVEAKLLELRQ